MFKLLGTCIITLPLINVKEAEMENKRKLSYRKPSNRGGEQFSFTIPKEYIQKMEITFEDRNINLFFNEETKEIIIKKATD